TLTRAPGGWRFIDIGGQVPASLVQPSRAEKSHLQEGKALDPRTVHVLFNPAAQRPEALWVQTNDLGAVLRAMHLHDGMIGGRVQINGHTPPAGAGGPLRGRLEVKDFTLLQAPLLARILAAASLPGIVNLLNHDGLAFSKLSGDFELAEGIVTMKQFRAHGGALGLTAKGTVEMKTSSLNLKGTVIPFYGLNTLLSRVPVVGSILSGGKGEGLIAVTYRLTGKFADPQVAVNPASVLTPGFLRGIFDLFESSNDVDIEQQLSPPSPQGPEP
ncbi:MAG TPA: AsmA-like C-terminal region-containing protein, partial [Candidatus Tectomicrobia bacterium]